MNISDFIVELLKKGNSVELPGFGTLKAQEEQAHMDRKSGTFYPARKTVALDNSNAGGCNIIEQIAAHECVDEHVAKMLWENYVDALQDKMDRVGAHTFEGLGTLKRSGAGFAFDEVKGLDLNAEQHQSAPIEHVNIYTPKEDNDPFAAFDAPEPVAEPVPEPVAEVVAAPIAEPEPLPEPEPVKVEAPKAEPVKAPEPVEAPKPEPAKVVETPKTEPVKVVEAPKTEPKEEEKQPEEPIDIIKELNSMPDTPAPKTKKKKKKHGWLWLLIILLLGGAGYYYYYMYRPTHPELIGIKDVKSIKDLKKLFVNNPEENLVAVPATEDSVAEETQQPEDTAAINDSLPTEEPEAAIEPNGEEMSNLMAGANIFTFNTDLIEFDDNDIRFVQNQVCDNLREYINQFLSNRHYTNARGPMMDRVAEYAQDRLGELLSTNQYFVQRFLPYEDYIQSYCFTSLKVKKGNNARNTVQTELMDYAILDQILNETTGALGLQPDAAPVATKAPEPKPAAPVYTASYTTQSKQGFDIVAGFFTSKASADKMATQLKNQGCDAYIIDKNHLYYVSMGSASTRTAAEALCKHIKTWYSGDVAIRELK